MGRAWGGEEGVRSEVMRSRSIVERNTEKGMAKTLYN